MDSGTRDGDSPVEQTNSENGAGDSADTKDQKRPLWFSSQGLLWHFGRFRGDSPKRPPFNQVLVGREKERGTFIRQLLNLPKRSSFLVTGSRGSGKTRFVNFCLEVYEENLLARYMRTDAGRTIYWDKICLILLLILTALSFSLLREALLLAAQPHSLPYVLLTVPLVVIGWVPFIYAEKMAKLVLIKPSSAGGIDQPLKMASYFVAYLSLLVAIIVPLYVIICASTAFLFLVCCFSYLSVEKKFSKLIMPLAYYTSGIAFLIYNHIITSVAFGIIALSYIINAAFLYKKINSKYLYRKIFLYLLLSTIIVYFGAHAYSYKEKYNYFLLFTILVTLVLSTFKVNTGKDLIVQSSRDRKTLQLLIYLKILFFATSTANIVHPAMTQYIPLDLSPNWLVRFMDFLKIQDMPQTVFSDQWVAIPVVFLLFLLLEYDLIILPQGYRLYVAESNPIFRKHEEFHGAEPTQGTSTTVGENSGKIVLLNTDQKNYIKYTFFWQIFNSWLPIITIRINLGFDTLDYRRVVEAMLLGLKKAYHHQFLSYSSVVANVFRISVFLIFCLLSSVCGAFWFRDAAWNPAKQTSTAEQQPKPTDNQPPVENHPPVREKEKPNGFRNMPIFMADVLYMDVFHDQFCLSGTTALPTMKVFFAENLKKETAQTRNPQVCLNGGPNCDKEHVTLTIYFYNVFLLIIFYLVFFFVRRRSVLFPYSNVYREINRMLEKFTSKTRGSIQESGPFKIPGLGSDISRTTGWEAEQLDPRTLELELISLLKRAQYPGIPLLTGPDHRMTLPQSEITFIFDELDKLGVRSANQGEEEFHTAEHLVLEKRRNIAIQNLLANMKNLLSSGSARYIFIGGRGMHDEWVADRAQRVPFLTNIFDAEIYLPSLLTDHPPYQAERMDWTARIKEFLIIQLHTGSKLWEEMHLMRFNSMAEHGSIDRLENAFNDFNVAAYSSKRRTFSSLEHPFVEFLSEQKLIKHKFSNPCDGASKDGSLSGAQTFSHKIQFGNDFLNFLTFRSYGNPKLLISILNSHIVNLEVVDYENRDGQTTSSTETSEFMFFDDQSVFRIQMISSIFQIITEKFNTKLIYGDDKPVVTLFYIVNFLLKFHRRGFSWTSIEHVDELVHVHKSIETRTLIKEVIDLWSDHYLDRIRNGVFDFRFSHHMSAELRLLSKFHLDELATVNFTLDESRHLKALYRQLIKEEGDKPNFEYFAVLGELHEYDGDFLYARNYFQKALQHLDTAFLENPLLGKMVLNVDGFSSSLGAAQQEPSQALVQFINKVVMSPELFQTSMDWAVHRLRFLIRIAMTYELANHFEKARFSYRAASQFGLALYNSWNAAEGEHLRELGESPNIDLSKTLNIIFLPSFAEAWAMEKSPATLDAGVGMLEHFLSQIETDFVRKVKDTIGFSKVSIGNFGTHPQPIHSHINFYVILAELLHKLGDLYFTKGKNLATPEDVPGPDSQNQMHGFLSAATEKYLCGMSYLLAYLNLRINESGMKYRLNRNPYGGKGATSFTQENLPDYFVRVLLGIVRDFSFTLMAKSAIHGIFEDPPGDAPHGIFNLTKWEKGKEKEAVGKLLKPLLDDVKNFLKSPITNFSEPTSFFFQKDYPAFKYMVDHEKVTVRETILLSFALQCLASRELLKGGYPGKSIRSLLQTAETAQHYLEWVLMCFIFGAKAITAYKGKEEFEKFLGQIWQLGTYCIQEAEVIADIAHTTDRKIQGCHLKHALESLVFLYQSAGISISEPKSPENQLESLKAIHNDCTETLFPFGFRLRGMKSLADHLMIQELFIRLVGKTKNKDEQNEKIDNHIEHLQLDIDELCREILYLDKQFDNNYIFSPFYQGVTFALAAKYFEFDNSKKAKYWKKHGLAYLSKSKQMFTQGRAYYDFISNHYFLYEDFNDREFQFGHAIQMAGSDVISILLKFLREGKSASQA